MKVVIAGRGSVAVRAVDLFALMARICRPDVAIECVPVSGDTGDDWRPSLGDVAAQNGLSCHEDICAAGLGPSDLLLSLQHPTVIRMVDLGGARAVNLHFSPLPRHRGSLSCYWPIVGRDGTAGVTLHELVEKVDAGPIIARRTFEIPPFVTAGDLFRLFHDHAFELLAAHAAALLSGSYVARPQPSDPAVPAHRRRDVDFARHEITDFDRPVAVVRADVLALVFPGLQSPTVRGRPVRSAYVLPVDGAPVDRFPAGTVVTETGRAAVLACTDGLLCVEYA